MHLQDAITARRSVRNYADTPLDRAAIEQVIRNGTLAPSAKNRQPWQFIVVEGNAKAELLTAMQQGLEREQNEARLPDSRSIVAGAKYTLRILKKAPTLIAVLDPLKQKDQLPQNQPEFFYDIADTQSLGACMQNMILTATALGLGSLWVCDHFSAYPEVCAALGTDRRVAAILVLGMAEEAPLARPRKAAETITEWRK